MALHVSQLRIGDYNIHEFDWLIWYWKQSRFSHLDRHLDQSETEMQHHWLLSNKIYLPEVPKKPVRNKGKGDKQILAELNSAPRRS